MTTKEKAATRFSSCAALRVHDKLNAGRQQIASLLKALIMRAACRGLLPRNVAGWIIQRGGLRDA